MKSIQSRLLVTLLVSFVLLWSAVSTWLLVDLQGQLRNTLDQRLASSARMVAGLLEQIPEAQLQSANLHNQFIIPQQPVLEGVACQVRLQSGELLLRTRDGMDVLLDSPEPGFEVRNFEGENWRLFTYQHGELIITTADQVAGREALYRSVLTAVAGPVLIALIGMLLATWWGIRRGLRPLYQLGQALQQRRADQLEPLELPVPLEIAPLQLSLNSLLERVRTLLAKEQRFTSDAAHELRTPLTAIKTNVQLAQRLDPINAREVLSDAEESVSRMQQIIEQLLTLARLDADSATNRSVPGVCKAETVIAKALADLDGLERLLVKGDMHLYLSGDADLLAIAVRNLLDNALAYSKGAVELNVYIQGTQTFLCVRDYGPGLSDRNKALALERFWRGDNKGVNKATAGSGLGLAITQQVCRQTGMQLKFIDASPGLSACLISDTPEVN